MRTKSYKSQVVNKYKRAFAATAESLNQANQDAITQVNYWSGFEGRVTYRQNGEVVQGAFRSIFDLGNIAQSQKLDITNGKASISWDGGGETPVVPVFFGYRTADTYVPGRNWVELALQNVNLAKMFKDNF